MQHSFTYDKKKVIQGLRYHFIHRPEVRILIVLVNVFAIVSAILFYTGKIRPEPFLLGSVIWLLLVVSFWYLLPNSIYRRAHTFRDSFTMYFRETEVRLENPRGYVEWPWTRFSKFFESPHFFHLYFDAKSFFIVPKDGMTEDFKHELRGVLNGKIKK
ncbi:YcxB family protein [Sediminibacterium soli]|uniref:YcxB family protein n=1 Tax=Sediminibacterium soli TaxID=2698829 RepID=UPI001379461A|nr:YcxB family protein [Sediminibacterium soli]NCI47353.1 YcxB family protein [Sediminibacterium soli]